MLEALRKDHRRLAELADRIEACLDDTGPLVAMRLGQLRCELAHEAIRHTIVEDRCVYRALEESDRELLSRHWETFPSLRTDLFFQRLQQYIHRWDAPAIERDRQRYGVATREMMGLLRTRMELEEHILFPRFDALQVRGRRTRGPRPGVSRGREVRQLRRDRGEDRPRLIPPGINR